MQDEMKQTGQCKQGCETNSGAASEWFCCWSTLETLARDAGALYEKCGGNCTIEQLSEWRERVIAQVRATLEEEEQFFESLKQASAGPEPGTLGEAA